MLLLGKFYKLKIFKFIPNFQAFLFSRVYGVNAFKSTKKKSACTLQFLRELLHVGLKLKFTLPYVVAAVVSVPYILVLQ